MNLSVFEVKVYIFGFFDVDIFYLLSRNVVFKIDLLNGMILVNFIIDREINEVFLLIVIVKYGYNISINVMVNIIILDENDNFFVIDFVLF